MIPVPESTSDEAAVMVIGRVIGIHIQDDVIADGLVDVMKMKPIARLGYFNYAVADNIFSIDFADYTKSAEMKAPSRSRDRRL
jgi:flavin reductase (DIM6/NTAB) family NADH-FMN oxidoreductase RutF